jgi:hypothetical protein
MKNISATNGTSLVQIFLMDDRSTAVVTATSTSTPQVGSAVPAGLGRERQ